MVLVNWLTSGRQGLAPSPEVVAKNHRRSREGRRLGEKKAWVRKTELIQLHPGESLHARSGPSCDGAWLYRRENWLPCDLDVVRRPFRTWRSRLATSVHPSKADLSVSAIGAEGVVLVFRGIGGNIA